MTARKRPEGHVLDVALNYMRSAGASVTALRLMEEIAAEYKARDRAFDAHADRKRIAEQRAIFAQLPEFGPGAVAAENLKQAMISRAWRLLDGGESEACDALLEFLPEADADKMLNEYFFDDANEKSA